MSDLLAPQVNSVVCSVGSRQCIWKTGGVCGEPPDYRTPIGNREVRLNVENAGTAVSLLGDLGLVRSPQVSSSVKWDSQ